MSAGKQRQTAMNRDVKETVDYEKEKTNCTKRRETKDMKPT